MLRAPGDLRIIELRPSHFNGVGLVPSKCLRFRMFRLGDRQMDLGLKD